jgi:7-cyano-7-deazaguanine synthase
MQQSAVSSADGQPQQVGLLLSGGLDSLILLGHLLETGYRVQPLYVRCGLYWEDAELRAVARILEAFRGCAVNPLVVLELPVADLYGLHWSLTGQSVPAYDSAAEAVFLPGRNVFLLTKAGIWCLLHNIPGLALAVLGTNPFGDASPEFFQHLEEVLTRAVAKPFRILTPFARMDKKSVMLLGRKMPLELSFSCIAPSGDQHCGRCNKCAERHEAFLLAGLPDPTLYAQSVETGFS